MGKFTSGTGVLAKCRKCICYLECRVLSRKTLAGSAETWRTYETFRQVRGACDARLHGCSIYFLRLALARGRGGILHAINQTAPDDLVRKKNHRPGNKTNANPQLNKPEPLPCSGVTGPHHPVVHANRSEAGKYARTCSTAIPGPSAFAAPRPQVVPKAVPWVRISPRKRLTDIFQSDGPPPFHDEKMPRPTLVKYHADCLRIQLHAKKQFRAMRFPAQNRRSDNPPSLPAANLRQVAFSSWPSSSQKRTAFPFELSRHPVRSGQESKHIPSASTPLQCGPR